MTDAEAIAALIHEYAARIDAGDLDGVAALFTRARWCSSARPGGIRGREAVRRVYDDVVLHDGTPRTQHLITNLVVVVTRDRRRATARSRFTVLQALPDFPLQAIISGRYEDRFARDGRTWRFAERRIVPVLVGDLSRHLRSAAPPTGRRNVRRTTARR